MFKPPSLDEPIFFTGDIIIDQRGRRFRVLDTPNRVRVTGSNQPAYIYTDANNVDIDEESGHTLWVQTALEVESGRFHTEDGRGTPEGQKTDTDTSIRGWAVVEYDGMRKAIEAATLAGEAGLYGLLIKAGEDDDTERVIAAANRAQRECEEVAIGLMAPADYPVEMLRAADTAKLDACLLPDVGVDVGRWDETGKEIRAAFESRVTRRMILFAGVTFLDSDKDPDLAASVNAVQQANMVPVTSGSKADAEVIRKRAQGGRLAFAGGLNPVTVEPMLDYITDAIASDGIGLSTTELHPAKCRGFAESCRERQMKNSQE